jgi:thymidylate synthase ThyX
MKITLQNSALNGRTGDRITTFILDDFPKFLLAEFNTHRMLSRNWESSRARPVLSIINQVNDDPYVPLWTADQKGMSGIEIKDDEIFDEATRTWLETAEMVKNQVIKLHQLGIHKQDANRLLEPFVKVSGIVTATEWENFFDLRTKPGVQPAFREFAIEMRRLYRENTNLKIIHPGDWYKPWDDLDLIENTSKAAGISYKAHAKDKDYESHKRLHDRLKDEKHVSPFEHCAIAIYPGMLYKQDAVFDTIEMDQSVDQCQTSYDLISTGNFSGFLQYRKILEAGLD